MNLALPKNDERQLDNSPGAFIGSLPVQIETQITFASR